MYDFLWNLWIVLGFVTVFAYIGDLMHAYMRDYSLAKEKGEDPEKVDAPDLIVIIFSSALLMMIWPAFWYAFAKARICKTRIVG